MGNIARRPDGKWRARYRDASGRERTKQFVRKVDAQRWLTRPAKRFSKVATSTLRPAASRFRSTRTSG
ncbi:hypothetical protein [Terrabacter sp. MAHUQ-38]|uniref:hypothetical protein n=1 Tax=unclassified Terrabacter TaxID=2630222 RepID=UPI00165DA154|nr:hypothetical protein [Terrabacter sp. MAHUQ-38]MBC9821251.1 hypothetical protein [Terrabacter sp. MAHUQ-38]